MGRYRVGFLQHMHVGLQPVPQPGHGCHQNHCGHFWCCVVRIVVVPQHWWHKQTQISLARTYYVLYDQWVHGQSLAGCSIVPEHISWQQLMQAGWIIVFVSIAFQCLALCVLGRYCIGPINKSNYFSFFNCACALIFRRSPWENFITWKFPDV